MSRSINAVRNIFWGIFNRCVGTLVPFLTRTLLIYTLGNEYIGLNSLFTSILSVLNLSELGIGTALIFSMYEPLAKKDQEKVCALLNLYRKCYFVIGIIVAVIGGLLLPFLDRLILGDCPADVNIYVLYLIYLVNTLLSYLVFAYKKSLLIASQRVDIQSNINSMILFVQNILQFLLIWKFRNYYFYVLVLPVCTIIENITASIIVDKKYPEYRAEGKIRFDELADIKQKIVGLLFQRLGNVVFNSGDNIIISAFLGLTILGIYNNYYYIILAVYGFLMVISTSLKPVVGNSIVLESHEKNLNDFFQTNFMYIWLVSWGTSILLCLYQPFIELWVGAHSLLSDRTVLLLGIYFCTSRWGDMLFVYQEAAGLWWRSRYVPITAAIVNLMVNITLVKIIGLNGVILSSIFSSLFIYEFGYATILFNEYFGKKYFTGFLKQELRYLAVAFATCSFTYYICFHINTTIVLTLIIRSVVCIVLPNIMMCLAYRKNKFFKSALSNIKSKLKK